MGSLALALVAVAFFVFGYRVYGGMLANRVGLSDENPTPAHEMYDGVDYVPAKAPVLLGHHFASIAGAGPILGPVIAAVFGWGPVYLWILLGAVFIGAVHDFTSLVASVRNRGKSIGEIVEGQLGPVGKALFLTFSWFTLVLVVAVFARIVATTFEKQPNVATASILFIVLAIFFGFAVYRRNLPLGPTTVVGVVLLFLAVFLGNAFPISLSAGWWLYILLAYIFVASVTPVWILLQPRDYLNSFLLYAILLGGLFGLMFAHPSLHLPVFGSFKTNLGTLFPILFVTVACGAISGFHSLVASGTTAKQLDKETDARPVGYGGMLIEGVLAVLALVAAASLSHGRYQELYQAGAFVTVFSEGVGKFLHALPLLGISEKGGSSFAGLAVSAFVLTSLDTATRLARFAFQEFFETGRVETSGTAVLAQNRFIGTAVTVVVAWFFLTSGTAHAIWPVFGSANQMLAALSLLAVTLWLRSKGVPSGVTFVPMLFMYTVTVSALVILIRMNVARHNFLLAGVGTLLLVVALVLAVESYFALRRYARVAWNGAQDREAN